MVGIRDLRFGIRSGCAPDDGSSGSSASPLKGEGRPATCKATPTSEARATARWYCSGWNPSVLGLEGRQGGRRFRLPASGSRLRLPAPASGSGFRLRLPAPASRFGFPLRLPAPASRSGFPLRLPAPASRSGFPLRLPASAPRFGLSLRLWLGFGGQEPALFNGAPGERREAVDQPAGLAAGMRARFSTGQGWPVRKPRPTHAYPLRTDAQRARTGGGLSLAYLSLATQRKVGRAGRRADRKLLIFASSDEATKRRSDEATKRNRGKGEAYGGPGPTLWARNTEAEAKRMVGRDPPYGLETPRPKRSSWWVKTHPMDHAAAPPRGPWRAPRPHARYGSRTANLRRCRTRRPRTHRAGQAGHRGTRG